MNTFTVDNNIFEVNTMRRTIQYKKYIGQYKKEDQHYVDLILNNKLKVSVCEINTIHSLLTIKFSAENFEIVLCYDYQPRITKEELIYLVKNNKYDELKHRIVPGTRSNPDNTDEDL